MSDKEYSALVEKIKLLKYGESLESVREKVGKPSSEGINAGKAFDSEKRPYLEYAVSVVESGGANAYDKVITLNFTADGHLDTIAYSMLEPIDVEIIRRNEICTNGIKQMFVITRPRQ